MTLDEVIMLGVQGVSVCLKTKSPLGPPEGTLLKVMTDGKGEVHLYADNAMKEKHKFVYHYQEWRRSGSLEVIDN